MTTYYEALRITEKSDAFYVQRGTVNGYEYAMFNYRLATYEDFINEEWDARELRGLTFIKDNNEWVAHPMLQKFWNVNENVSTQYHDIKNKEIETVEFKEDGSLITFVVLPNGEVVPKTKMSFDNDQTELVKKFCLTPEIERMVKINKGYSFLFELVSPRNKIVLKYPVTQLRLLQIRNKRTGEYVVRDEVEKLAEMMGVSVAETFNYTLDELMELRETLEDVEGWVIKFTDGQMVKLKTEWYVEKHGLMDDLDQENKIIEMILDETIDDITSELEVGSEEREWVEGIIKLIDDYFNERVENARELQRIFIVEYSRDRKSFAIDYSKVQDFGVVMKNIDGSESDYEKAIKERIKVETNKLEKARALIESLKEKK